ncbi:lytic murein transglycosylase [Stagnihabitans tardus]|uniref:Lytic murein transglycosylase n=1 Tax=Stagnihabitans tardus TaxID=2699202 RepID=A0AAE4YCQ8_9RHOB|nr:peptidoglycan-binding protein [Stagnihabitans tardus]NBZ87225.1 lytic murein transglycosylase [Stagnihabitans tardus]
MRLALALLLASALPALSAPCGGDFKDFKAAMAAEARAMGLAESAIEAFMAGAQVDKAVLKADRGQGFFRKNFIEFSQALISKSRLQNAGVYSKKHDRSFDEAARRFGVPRGMILAFWAFETDFGAVQGDFDTRNALMTLAHDCRRPELFQPQVLAAIALTAMGDFEPGVTKGAWAGEIGQVQMLPKDILERGEDGDGDGLITLKTSAPDAILSAAHMLQYHGWRPNEPWLQEVVVPEQMDWSQAGIDKALPASQWAQMGVRAREGDLANLQASLLLPMGRKGPAFLAYPNYKVLFEWNKSFVYVTTAAYFATRIEGAAPYDAGDPEPGLSADQMKALQQRLAAKGYDVGKIDGVLGAMTRAAVQKEQAKAGMPADGWPTPALLGKL